MKKVLEELTLNYNAIIKTENYELTKVITFSDDIIHAFEALMQSINKVYVRNIKPNKQIRVFLKKDKRGNCYLKVEGRDHNTKLIIRSNESKVYDYYSIEGYKITESVLAKTVDIVGRDKLEKSGISKRFIKEVIPEIDLYEEMDIETFIRKCKEIEHNMSNTIEFFDEPENTNETNKRSPKLNDQKERINPIIPYEERQKELLKYNHKKIIRFKGKKTDKVFDAYIYIRNGHILAIVEPLSGLGYQYNLNLGFAEDYNEEKIKEMIKVALEAKENIVMLDNAIIRKNHTTIESFKENIELFLTNKGNDKKFIEKVSEAALVYKKVKK